MSVVDGRVRGVAARETPMLVDERMVELGELRIYVKRIGAPELPPLIAVHGGPTWDHSYLLPAVGELSDVRQVHLLDVRGCGRSGRELPVDALRHVEAAEDILRVADALDLGAFDLLGFSYGGALAMRVAERHPRRLRSLILASTSAYGNDIPLPPTLEAERARREPPGPASWERASPVDADLDATDIDATDLDAVARADALAAAAVHIWDLRRLPEWRQVLERIQWSGAWNRRYLEGPLDAPRPPDPEEALRQAGVPILILHGENDLGFAVESAHRLHAAVPGSHLVVMPGVAHMAQFEQPQEWAAHIRHFLTTPATRTG
jgi:pimeloyl-ACP methyl ester carboxylesterase